MKRNTKSSITLPPEEFKQVERIRKSLGAKSNVEVVRQGIRLLNEKLDRELLRASYREASAKAREVSLVEIKALDSLTDEGLDR